MDSSSFITGSGRAILPSIRLRMWMKESKMLWVLDYSMLLKRSLMPSSISFSSKLRLFYSLMRWWMSALWLRMMGSAIGAGVHSEASLLEVLELLRLRLLSTLLLVIDSLFWH